MHDDTTLLTIGEPAERTGMTVKLVRHWSDMGCPADRPHPGRLPALRRRGRRTAAAGADPARYWQVMCVISRHPVRPSIAAAGRWLLAALRSDLKREYADDFGHLDEQYCR
ncbi:MerR family transcriptional regulator [Sphaerisporangium corydalis]|uniref:MerR family transcriptional regulator n=1 Tax=Sphaerisporangium corydalis TaxID=1441875 RepID=A0ABV9EM22_9ACTN|nr:hypothetical protein [Sphaerisporangium corydalis]